MWDGNNDESGLTLFRVRKRPVRYESVVRVLNRMKRPGSLISIGCNEAVSTPTTGILVFVLRIELTSA